MMLPKKGESSYEYAYRCGVISEEHYDSIKHYHIEQALTETNSCRFFTDKGIECVPATHGTVLVTLSNGQKHYVTNERFRQQGKHKWYWHKGLEHYFEKYYN